MEELFKQSRELQNQIIELEKEHYKSVNKINNDNLLVIFIGIIVLIASLYNLYKLILCNKIGEKENK